MTFFQSIRTVFRKYADFTGTAARSEFWWWALFSTLVSVAIDIIADAATGSDTIIGALWALAVLLPSLAVAVRRLRDAGFSWAHLLWLLLPIVGCLITAVLCAQPPARSLATQPLATTITSTDTSQGMRS
ncbi:DUF805 domain-containing protein [Cryobacterium sinapicolor]|uniref:DUF805 domain-containing protein n=1 Tax=Cryobacterium sinapicolor TaxID=1259236 RepID=A0ABY2IWP4_9MICO|nr:MULTISPECIES: DUF805 domain-containing protein [Cryobacterium]TFC89920.1 DUF805 domain-containing protein [Cryobacterium sp. TMT3-29-2]TFC96406.1 DUF805 domain-containing protein [Cryobacterium sinapicolor]